MRIIISSFDCWIYKYNASIEENNKYNNSGEFNWISYYHENIYIYIYSWLRCLSVNQYLLNKPTNWKCCSFSLHSKQNLLPIILTWKQSYCFVLVWSHTWLEHTHILTYILTCPSLLVAFHLLINTITGADIMTLTLSSNGFGLSSSKSLTMTNVWGCCSSSRAPPASPTRASRLYAEVTGPGSFASRSGESRRACPGRTLVSID